MNWKRLLGPKVSIRDGAVIEESFWSDFNMPLANIADVWVEWIPYGPTQLVLESDVGNTVSIAVGDDSERVRALIGQYVLGTPLARWLSDSTREALILEGPGTH